MSRLTGILDYGMGNINSVQNALNYAGYENRIVKTAEEIASCSHLIIPGVGSYGKAMANLIERGLTAAILEHAEGGKPLLGICLGMQILSEAGEENGFARGLGLIKGSVQILNLEKEGLAVPHVGWNALEFHNAHPVFERIKKHVDFYFVHSYFFNAINDDNILASTCYGKKFPAIVGHKNIVGIQFHPEKSQDNGLLMIENFCEWDGLC